ncbi:MAG: hypothetical protein ABI652_04390 [Acidobacteriota bacterium]
MGPGRVRTTRTGLGLPPDLLEKSRRGIVLVSWLLLIASALDVILMALDLLFGDQPGPFGTPAYMAPEQALGRVQDAPSDIYAVGCVAYWLLTGHPVFAGDSPLAVLMHHAGSTPAPPSSRTEIAVPRALDDLIMSCLAKDAADRPQSAAVLAERLIAADVTASWTEARALDWWQRHHPVGTEIPGIAV